MGIVDDLLKRQSQMATDRYHWETIWRDVVSLFMPNASRRFDEAGATNRQALTGIANVEPTATRRGREIFDSTAIWAGERLVAGVESMITPRAQKWHALSIDDAFGREASDLEEEWLDKTRDYQFAARYDTRANFALANQKFIRSIALLGTGILYNEENMGRRGTDPVRVPFFYRHVPVIDCYLGVDDFDAVDTIIEVTEMTAHAAVTKFGADKVTGKVRDAANDPAKAEQRFTFMHAVLPRELTGDYKTKRAGFSSASFWIEVETKHLISDSGFYEMPYHVGWWDQVDGSAYGQSAPMAILSDVKMLQVMSKAYVQAAQNAVKPPMATMPGIYSQRLNMNAGAINPGYLDERGVMKAQPLLNGANLSFAEHLLELKRSGIRTGMYTDLFQILVENPQMTATEAIIRANEKGEMLGPAGAKIEHGLAKAVDRETAIIARKGAFGQGSPLEPPPSVNGRNTAVKFTGPMARLRRMQELQGMDSVLQVAERIGQYDPSILDRVDKDETLEMVREIRGAPRRMFRTDEEVAADRQERARQQEGQASMQAMQGMAAAAGKATPAIQAMMAQRAA